MAPERYFDSDPDSSVASDDVGRVPVSSKGGFLNVTSSALCHLVILMLLSVAAMFMSTSQVPERGLAKGIVGGKDSTVMLPSNIYRVHAKLGKIRKVYG